MSVIDRLRSETSAAHRRLQASPFAVQLVEGAIERRRYVDYLRATAIILDTLRTQTQRHGSPREQAACAHLPHWCDRLAADLEQLDPGGPLVNGSAHAAALAFTGDLRRWVAGGGAQLLGVAYVLAGSHMGNRSVAAKVEAALELEAGQGVRYLSATSDDPAGAWGELVEVLDRELAAPAALEEALEGARAAFHTFETIFAAVQDEARRVAHVSAINPEAGDHPITDDPELLELAIVGADCATAQFPYLGFRYGARGRSFARSDSAWLLTLLDLDERSAGRQIEWLAGLLAARGVPSSCLEVRLQILARALDERGGQAGAARLRELARQVARHRAGVSLQLDGLELELPMLGDNAGTVLACAVVDQARGVGRCADNISKWARAEPRFDEDERRAICDYLDRARELLAP